MKQVKWVVLAMAICLLQSAEGYAGDTPLNLELTDYSSQSDKVILQKYEFSTDANNTSRSFSSLDISGVIKNDTNYDIYNVTVRYYLKNAADEILFTSSDDAKGEGVIFTPDGNAILNIIKAGKTGIYGDAWWGFEYPVTDIKKVSFVVTFSRSIPYIRGDIDDDGDVDFDDFFILADNFGKTAATAVAKVVTDEYQRLRNHPHFVWRLL